MQFSACFYRRWIKHEVTLRAAALTYYAVFSLFPLLSLVASGVGWLLRDPARQRQIMEFMFAFFPRGNVGLLRSVEKVAIASPLSNVIAVVALLWSASGFLRGMLRAISVIHDDTHPRNAWWVHLWGVALVVLLMLVILGIDAVLSPFVRYLSAMAGSKEAVVWSVWFHWAALLGIASGVFYLLFRFIPRAKFPRYRSWIAAVFTAFLWTLTNWGFTWYLQWAFQRLNVVYGSLAAVIALMLYLYLVNVVILTGAQFHALLNEEAVCV